MDKPNRHASNPAPASPQRTVILGGGMAGLAAAYQLTNDPNWRAEREVTVYQMGWRLGGKCATGRNADYGQRIQEHGLHMLFGFYHNTHDMMRRAYEALDRNPGAPLARWTQAVVPYDTYCMQHRFAGAWHTWKITMPRNRGKLGVPGGTAPLTLIGKWVHRSAKHLLRLCLKRHASPLGQALRAEFTTLIGSVFSRSAASRTEARDAALGASLRSLLDRLASTLGDALRTDLSLYRAFITADVATTILVGVLADDVLHRGTASMDNESWQTWLERHGISQLTLDSCVVQTAFDSSFAVHNGAYDMEAGVVLNGALRMFFDYRGSIMWRFAAGAGDAMIAPLYMLLVQRGVRFRFFHRVDEIVSHASSHPRVDVVRLTEQVAIKGDTYAPLTEVQGLPCWPDRPDWSQLDPTQGHAINAAALDLERAATQVPGAKSVELQFGRDFDQVVCALSLGALPSVTRSLVARAPRWGDALDRLKTTRTQALQVWFDRPLTELGWNDTSSVLSCFGTGMNTWSDLSMTLPFEAWPEAATPRSVSYMCGPLTVGPETRPSRASDAQHALAQRDLVRRSSAEFIAEKLPELLPDAFCASGRFDWSGVVDMHERQGADRLEGQYYRANDEPWERYVLSVQGSSAFRLEPASSGFDGLFVAGDWTRTGLDAGCVEGAVISGLKAARGILGLRFAIPGEHRLGGRRTAAHPTPADHPRTPSVFKTRRSQRARRAVAGIPFRRRP